MAINGRLILALALAAGPASAQEPLSAIDWLRQTPTVTLDMGLGGSGPPVTESALSPSVGVEQLDTPGRDAVGLLPSNVTGLPSSLWQNSRAQVLADLLDEIDTQQLPAVQALLFTLLLAEANPPSDAGTADTLLHARIDKLIEMGALEQANALIERAGATTKPLFERWFNVTLLLGQEQRACDALMAAPHLAPGYPARIFCTARAGDWSAAALTLDTARVLQLVTEEQDALLARFLDPELFEGTPLPARTDPVTPLTFRLYEAIGEPLQTRSLPLAYAHADLRDTAGWKAQLEAAERLARTAAIPGNHLIGLYTEREPAASGMIWDRVAAIQSFDAAIASGAADQVAATLPAAWSAMKRARLEVPFARIYGDALLALDLGGVARSLARDIALLSDSYERAAVFGARDYAAMLADGAPPRIPPDPTRRAISDAFHGAGVPLIFTTQLAQGKLGEVILEAIVLMQRGAGGDPVALTQALATFRAIGLEDTARRAALQVLLLRRGG
ncbi:hypothetical protein [Shimia biformata]|uniref:hypothetical protein n=1 Tax=Shimia biformata TaxID=1294299 RepID=UPI00194F0B62|nr:hypothetical protein [Shimia biformata]